jgi:hypothetical protein
VSRRRDFIGGFGAGLVAKGLIAQSQSGGAKAGSGRGGSRAAVAAPEKLRAKTTVMRQTPKGGNRMPGSPNGLAMDERGRGIWYGEEEGPLGDRQNCEAILVDMNGKELKRLHSPAVNVSALAEGGGCVWRAAAQAILR